MPYFKDLSNNSYKIGRYTKGSVRSWMGELAGRVLLLKVEPAKKYRIGIKGYFTDKRHPDIHNLHKVIGDALKLALPVDDKHYFFVDEGIQLGTLTEAIEINIQSWEIKK